MIQADAHTNPMKWRRCPHLSLAVTPNGTRCDDCGAVIDASRYGFHGVGASTDSPVMGTTAFAVTEGGQHPSLCHDGHTQVWKRKVNSHGTEFRVPVCVTCVTARELSRMNRPCSRGHAPNWSPRVGKTAVCLDCRNDDYARKNEARRA